MNNKFLLTVFIGDVDISLANAAKTHDPDAFLIDTKNYKSIIANDLTRHTTIYTSLGDLPKHPQVLVDICLLADNVVYCPPLRWSDNKTADDFNPTDSVQGLTENLLLVLAQHKKIKSIDLAPIVQPMPLVDQRKTDQTQLWFAGCSMSHGVGVDPSQRYGQLVANELNMEASFLTRGGSSISWASDQIVRSDIGEGDIVIFGLTNIARLPYVKDKTLLPGVTILTYNTVKDLESLLPKHNLWSENTFYQHLLSIDRAINFCNKVKAKLILFGLLVNNSPNLLRAVSQKSNFVGYPYKISQENVSGKLAFLPIYTDLGTDNNHPGPLQHQQFAKFLLTQLK